MHFQLDWLRAIRHLTQYVVPGLILAAVIIELAGRTFTSPSLASAYDYLLAIIFSFLTILMIGICGWTVFLWDIDRLFFKLEGKIDADMARRPSGFTAQAATTGWRLNFCSAPPLQRRRRPRRPLLGRAVAGR